MIHIIILIVVKVKFQPISNASQCREDFSLDFEK